MGHKEVRVDGVERCKDEIVLEVVADALCDREAHEANGL